jgi:predicted enzyme related to lactoylglutathione lyase
MGDLSSLASVTPHPVLRAESLERAKAFYEDVLGLDVAQEPAPARELRVTGGDAMICIYERPTMPAPMNTTCCFEVSDIRAVVDQLRSRGVVFEDYDLAEMGLVTFEGIGEVNGHLRAWFQDSEGNILVLAQR